MSWADADIEKLKKLHAEHKTADEMALELKRGRGSVLAKCIRLGLKRKLTGAAAVSRILELVAEENLPVRKAAKIVGMPLTAVEDVWDAWRERYDFGLPAGNDDDVVRPEKAT